MTDFIYFLIFILGIPVALDQAQVAEGRIRLKPVVLVNTQLIISHYLFDSGFFLQQLLLTIRYCITDVLFCGTGENYDCDVPYIRECRDLCVRAFVLDGIFFKP